MLKDFKQKLQLRNPELKKIKSSHLTEIIAKSFGYKTHASLIASDSILTEDCFWKQFNIEEFFNQLKQYNLNIERNDIISVIQYYKNNALPVFSDKAEFKKTLKDLKEKSHQLDKKHFHLPNIYTLILCKEMYQALKTGDSFVNILSDIMNNELYTKDFDEKLKKKIFEVQKNILNRLSNGGYYLSAINPYINPYMAFLFFPLNYGFSVNNEYLNLIKKQVSLDNNAELNFIKIIDDEPLWDKNFNFILSYHFFKTIMNNGDSISTLLIEKYFLSFAKNDNLLLHILIDIIICLQYGKNIKEILKKYACNMNISTYDLVNMINEFY